MRANVGTVTVTGVPPWGRRVTADFVVRSGESNDLHVTYVSGGGWWRREYIFIGEGVQVNILTWFDAIRSRFDHRDLA